MKIKGKITMFKIAREYDRYCEKTGKVPKIIKLTKKQFSEYYSLLITKPMPKTLFFRGIKVIYK